MRYVQSYGQKRYNELNNLFQSYTSNKCELKETHAETFGLGEQLKEEEFNLKQKLVIIGGYAN